jgi:transposase
MPKKVVLHPHLTPEELKEQYLTRTDRVEARRYHLLWLISTGLNIKQAAQLVGFSYDYAKDLVAGYNANGVDAIANLRQRRTPPGRTPLLTKEQYSTLKDLVRQPPPDGEEWTGAKVAEWIGKTTGKPEVKYQRGWDYLRRCQNDSSTAGLDG